MKTILPIFALFSSALALPHQRIIGGVPANAGEFPYAAAISYSTANGHYFCGGSLIGQQYVITSGHCVYQAVSFNIILGSTKRDGSDETALKVSSFTPVAHPEFNPDTFANDVGLIHINLPVTYTDYIKPIKLPQSDLADSNTVVMAIGWGQTSDDESTFSSVLLRTSIIAIPNSECKNYYGDQIIDSMVCVEGNFNEGACNGDLGGPLVRHAFNQDPEIVGISSFLSAKGCESVEPSGYTRVFAVIDWIRNTTRIVD